MVDILPKDKTYFDCFSEKLVSNPSHDYWKMNIIGCMTSPDLRYMMLLDGYVHKNMLTSVQHTQSVMSASDPK